MEEARKKRVLLTGASGSMGFEAFRLLWERRGEWDIVLLLRPSKKNRKMFRKYMGDVEIIWGDALNKPDLEEAIRGIDVCLHTMALISPGADRDPEMAKEVNQEATRRLVEAIEAEDPEHIRLVSIASIAQYGDRLPPVHVGRTGDPMIPSVFDHYALSKIGAELAVMQSRIRHRVSLRQTFIMIPGLFSLKDPIMFHQPLHSHMENITARDAGRLLVNCLDVPEDSDFWGEYYNIGGGPSCRITYLEFMGRIYGMLGMRCEKVMDRRWFALKNFHMLIYGDGDRLNSYLHHWEGGQDLEDYFREVWNSLPSLLRIFAWFARHVPLYRLLMELFTRMELKKLAGRPRGPLFWQRMALKEDADALAMIKAFYGSVEAMESIPDWGVDMPLLDVEQEWKRLDHGYDESKKKLDREDLQGAAAFRGGSLLATRWAGDWHELQTWKCHRGHMFQLTPHAMLRGGHWCPDCIAPPWDYKKLADGNPFAAQVLCPDH